MDAQVQALWVEMNKTVPKNRSIALMHKPHTSSTNTKNHRKFSNNWAASLGLTGNEKISPLTALDGSATDADKKAAAMWQQMNKEIASKESLRALTSVADASSDHKQSSEKRVASNKDRSGLGTKVFLVDPSSEDGNGKMKVSFATEAGMVMGATSQEEGTGKGKAGTASAVDSILEQIKKKPKMSVLEKTRKDWGEFKEENKSVEEELDAYKRSSRQYIEKLSFLQRADYREFERERDARLALQGKRRADDV